MKQLFLFPFILIFSAHIFAQKTINNPDCISTNINGKVTKVELTDTETILHFHIRSSIGSWIAIPRETYIEDSAGKGERLFIEKTEGITLTGKNYMKDSDEIRYKLYFPPLSKDVKHINYGESNRGGNWFIYKLDITKDGIGFLNSVNKIIVDKNDSLSTWKVVVGQPSNVLFRKKMFDDSGWRERNKLDPNRNTELPKDLPKDFFGSWYDKYGTLILIVTPEYIVSDFRVQYYQHIEKLGEDKFKINSTSKSFEILNLDKDNMTIRTNRLMTLKRGSNLKTVPSFLRGKWKHWAGVKEMTITEDTFYINDHGDLGVYEVTGKIDNIIETETAIWFVIYKKGAYSLYNARKVDGEYVMQPRGFYNAKYKRVED